MSSFNFKTGFDIKIKNFFEQSETFFNLEFRPQKTQKVFKESKSLCLYSLLTYILTLNTSLDKIKNFNHTFFIGELLSEASTFKLFSKKKYSNFFFAKESNVSKTAVSTYLFKPQTQCFYTANYFSRYSIFMLKASKEYQQIANNFYL